MLLLYQTLSSLEKQWVLAQATQVGDDYYLQWAPIPVAPKNEGINVPIPTGTQAVPLTDPHKKGLIIWLKQYSAALQA
jgi:hypothetical protein